MRKTIALCLLIAGITGCTLEKKNPVLLETNVNDAIEMLSYVFHGNYSNSIIKESMDILFIKYEIKPERNNYLRIGNTLTEYRKQSKGQFQEMDIISEMIIVAQERNNHTFDAHLQSCVKKLKAKM